MIIGPPKIRHDAGRAILMADVRFNSQSGQLWYAVEGKYDSLLVSTRLDGFLVGLLPLAMKLGEDIKLEAPVSEKLYYNLANYYQHILSKQIPSLKMIDITPQSLDSAEGFRSVRAMG